MARTPPASAATRIVSRSGAAYRSTYPGMPGLRKRRNASSRSATTPATTRASAMWGRPLAAASPETRATSSSVSSTSTARSRSSTAGTREDRPSSTRSSRPTSGGYVGSGR